MRVFVLSTGRCGSTTFARACEHLTNFTAGHETRARMIGERRFDYPDQHVEVDNRLSWLLGGLESRFDSSDTLYVHLRRDPENVARSFLARWDSPFGAGIIRAFGNGVVSRGKPWPEERRLEVCRFYVETVTANIEAFTVDKPLAMRFGLEDAADSLPAFFDRIGAEGDLQAAGAEFGFHHNASV